MVFWNCVIFSKSKEPNTKESIRCFIIEISKLAKSNKGKQSKQAKLYHYFTSSEYYRDFEETNETKEKIDELQRKE